MSSGGGGRLTRMTQLLEGKNAIIDGTIVNATCGMVPG
jgi:hypothetical protein